MTDDDIRERIAAAGRMCELDLAAERACLDTGDLEHAADAAVSAAWWSADAFALAAQL